MTAKTKLLGTMCSILSATIYGFNAYIVLFANEGGSNSVVFTFWSSVLSLPAIMLAAWMQHVALRPTKKQVKDMCIVGFFGTVTTLLLFCAFSYIASGIATVLHFTYPVYVGIASVVFLHKKMTVKKASALLISIIGIALISDFSGQAAAFGFVLALLSGITYTAYVVLLEKWKLDSLNPVFVCFHMSWIRALIAGVFACMTKTMVVHMTAAAWMATFVQGVVSLFVATMLFQLGVRYIGSLDASVFSMFEPLTCLFVGVALLGEKMNLTKSIGCVLIMLGIFIVIQEGIKNEKREYKRDMC